ncbi:MAG: bacterial Ig-like domain-containing protein, partial [Bacillota bacterium]
MKKKLLFIIIIILLIAILSACVTDMVRADARVESIAVDGIVVPYYFVGDDLDLDDATLYVMYEDGEEDQIPVTKDMIDPSFNTNEPGKKTVIINYREASTSFEVEILDLEIESVEVLSYPNKTTYIEGTDFEVEGATLAVHSVGGRVVNVPVLTNNVTQFNSNRIG